MARSHRLTWRILVCRVRQFDPFPGRQLWLAAAVLAALAAAWAVAAGFAISPGGFTPQFILACLALAVGLALARRWPTLSTGCLTFAFMVMFGKVMRVLNYLGSALGRPWRDDWLARADAALGLDWLAFVAFVNGDETVRTALNIAYDGLHVMTVATLIWLVAERSWRRLREFLWLFVAMAVATVAIGALWPAAGAFVHLQPRPEIIANLPAEAGRYYLPHLLPLHAGAMKTIDLGNMAGLVQFPSFHTALACLIMWAARGRLLVVPFAVIAVAIIAASPVYGGHYFVDLVAGVAVFALAVVAHRGMMSGQAQWRRRHPGAPAPMLGDGAGRPF